MWMKIFAASLSFLTREYAPEKKNNSFILKKKQSKQQQSIAATRKKSNKTKHVRSNRVIA